MRFGVKADNGLEHPEIVHQLDERNEGHQRHQMRDDHVANLLPAGRTVDTRGLDLFHWKGLQAGIKYDKGKRRSVPDAINDQ